MRIIKYIARKILANEIHAITKERNLYIVWTKHHQSTIKRDRIKLTTYETRLKELGEKL